MPAKGWNSRESFGSSIVTIDHKKGVPTPDDPLRETATPGKRITKVSGAIPPYAPATHGGCGREAVSRSFAILITFFLRAVWGYFTD